MPVHAPEMREELAASALKLFSRHGITRVSLDQIAADAGVTKGSFYWHYKSKRAVILAACEQYYRNWHRRVRDEMACEAEPLAQLERVLHFSVQNCLFDEENRRFTTEIFALALEDEEIRGGWAQFYDSVRNVKADLVAAAVHRGQLPAIDPIPAVDWMLSTLEGIKQRAAFEPQIRTSGEKKKLVQGLMRILEMVG